uniref:Uncharacterized protein n=1 Tax=Parascaris equorum TaxID=6256 RepID=A0A914R0V3_PAREQ
MNGAGSVLMGPKRYLAPPRPITLFLSPNWAEYTSLQVTKGIFSSSFVLSSVEMKEGELRRRIFVCALNTGKAQGFVHIMVNIRPDMAPL